MSSPNHPQHPIDHTSEIMNELTAIEKKQYESASPHAIPGNKKPHHSPGPGRPLPTYDVFYAGAAATQCFASVQQICAHRNAVHVYANDTSRHVERNHYCTLGSV